MNKRTGDDKLEFIFGKRQNSVFHFEFFLTQGDLQIRLIRKFFSAVLTVSLSCIFLFSCTMPTDKLRSPVPEMTFSRFLENFENPPRSYAPAPLFVWNDLVTKDELDFHLDELKNKGFGGVFVHPRPGMVNEYLSDNWFDLFDHTISRCKTLGMDVWIYDENAYPSGFAGGYVPEQMPSSYNQGQGLNGTRTDSLPADMSGWEIVLRKNGNVWEDITGSLKNDTNTTGKYYLFKKTYYKKSPWFGSFSYVDLLKPGVTDKFIDITLKQGYEKHFPDEIGKEIKGVFSDEPGIFAPDRESLRWTPDLFEYFKKKFGYELKTCLPSLYEETGDWRRVRHDYYKALLDLFTSRWSKPMSSYCEKHGMQWTGHYWEHKWPDPDQCPDNMAMYAWPQVPAIDLLYNDFSETRYNEFNKNDWPQAQFGNARVVKELSSVANQLDKSRSLSESFGGSGWDFTFNDMKRLGDWEYALGVNFMCQHLADMSIKGARKYDYPPTYSYQEPWWDDYKTLNDYFGRLSFALSSGHQVNHILVIEPTTTTWMYAARGKVTGEIVALGKSFHEFIHRLEKLQIEYDLGSENIFESHGREWKGKFRVGSRDYDIVVIPPGCENLDHHTADLLGSFMAHGGTVISFASPRYIDGQSDTDKLQKLESHTGWISSKGLEDRKTQEKLFAASPDFRLRDTLTGKLYHQRRMLRDGQLFFAVNSDKKEMASASVELKGKSVVRLDPFSGLAVAYPADEAESGMIRLNFELYPSESILLYILNESGQGLTAGPRKGTFEEMKTNAPSEVSATGLNVLALDFCDLKLKDTVFTDLHVLDASKRVFKAHGFEAGNPWNTMIQFRSETLKRDTFPEGSGYTAIYNFPVSAEVEVSDFRLVVEGKKPAPLVRVNGRTVNPVADEWWVDRSFLVYPAGQYLNNGMNRIEVVIDPMSVMAEVEPVYILGRFSLKSAEKGWMIEPPKMLKIGSWEEQGWPFYAGSIDYSRTIKINETGNYRIRLKDWEGTVAEVLVNGRKAGVIFSPPYLMDISSMLSPGMNTITVRVMGSNRNLFGPFHGDLPVGLASAHQWDNITVFPAGSKYQVPDYGLMEDFVLETNTEL